MQSTKIDVKLFATDETSLEPEELIPVFHRWIQSSHLDELLIDVADYSHVPHGPALLLIAHDAHYAWHLEPPGPGLLYSRRRETHPSLGRIDGPDDRLRSVLRKALAAAHQLEQEVRLGGRVGFRTDRFELTLNDRLHAPNDQATEARIRPVLEPLLAELYPGADVAVERLRQEPRRRFTLAVRAAATPELGELLQRLEGERADTTPVVAGGRG